MIEYFVKKVILISLIVISCNLISSSSSSPLKLHSVLVTGSNRGLGLQFIKEIIKLEPKHIIATCREPANAKELNELAKQNVNVKIIQLEMTNFSAYDSFVKKVENIVGDNGLTLVIQNAGLKASPNLDQLKPENLIEMYKVNSIAPILLTRKLMPALIKSARSGRKTIVGFMSSYFGSLQLNTAKEAEHLPEDIYIGYRMSKSALNQGVLTLRTKFKDESINFALLHPGHVLKKESPIYKYLEITTIEDGVKGLLKQLGNKELIEDGRVITYDGKLLPF